MNLKVIVEEHKDGFVAYPIGMSGVVVAEGDTFESAVSNLESAVRFHIETFGSDAFPTDDEPMRVSVVEAAIAV